MRKQQQIKRKQNKKTKQLWLHDKKYTTYHVNVGKNVAYNEDNAKTFYTRSGTVKLKLKGVLGESV